LFSILVCRDVGIKCRTPWGALTPGVKVCYVVAPSFDFAGGEPVGCELATFGHAGDHYSVNKSVHYYSSLVWEGVERDA